MAKKKTAKKKTAKKSGRFVGQSKKKRRRSDDDGDPGPSLKSRPDSND